MLFIICLLLVSNVVILPIVGLDLSGTVCNAIETPSAAPTAANNDLSHEKHSNKDQPVIKGVAGCLLRERWCFRPSFFLLIARFRARQD